MKSVAEDAAASTLAVAAAVVDCAGSVHVAALDFTVSIAESEGKLVSAGSFPQTKRQSTAIVAHNSRSKPASRNR